MAKQKAIRITDKAIVPTRVAPRTTLSPADEAALKEILDEGQALVDSMEVALRRFAQLVVRRAFGDDHKLARDPVADATPLYAEVLRRAGGPTLKLSPKILRLWVRIAAWERTITSEEFRRLDFGRKQHLLPIGDAKTMADAAEHIVAFKLNEADTIEYVQSLRKGTLSSPIPRLTPARAGTAIEGLVERFTRHGALARLEAAVAELDDSEKKALAKKVDEAAELLARLRVALRK